MPSGAITDKCLPIIAILTMANRYQVCFQCDALDDPATQPLSATPVSTMLKPNLADLDGDGNENLVIGRQAGGFLSTTAATGARAVSDVVMLPDVLSRSYFVNLAANLGVVNVVNRHAATLDAEPLGWRTFLIRRTASFANNVRVKC